MTPEAISATDDFDSSILRELSAAGPLLLFGVPARNASLSVWLLQRTWRRNSIRDAYLVAFSVPYSVWLCRLSFLNLGVVGGALRVVDRSMNGAGNTHFRRRVCFLGAGRKRLPHLSHRRYYSTLPVVMVVPGSGSSIVINVAFWTVETTALSQ